MLVSLSLANDFRGRIYATGNPQACFELGTGQSDMTLRIPLGTECGTVQQVCLFVFHFEWTPWGLAKIGIQSALEKSGHDFVPAHCFQAIGKGGGQNVPQDL